MNLIPARLGLVQRVLPEYRVPFFDSLATASLQGLSVFTGKPRREEAIETGAKLNIAHHFQGINLHLFRGRYYLCWQLGLLRWLRRWQPQVLVVEANPRYLSTPLAINWMHLRGRPVVGWGLGTGGSAGIGAYFRRRFLHRFDALIAYSQSGAQQYITAGVDPRKVFVAPNAAARRPERPAIERPTAYKDGKPNLLFIGRLQARKRVDVLLRACATLPADLQPRLVIVGDGPERNALQELAWQVYPSAKFAGARHGGELEPYFTAADLFVLPGTGGLAVQQAMAHALPVVVGAADGTQGELVRPENGWLLMESSPEVLVETLRSALADIPRLRRMGRASYRIVAEEVNVEAMVEAFTRAVRFVLK